MRDLFTPCRYRAYHGGRGGTKSHSLGQALILKGAQKPLRILCCRETQKSIRDSVKRLLDDKIAAAGLGDFYTSIETEIRGANGTLFVFAGLRTDPNTIRSLEGIDIAWVEEAHSVSQASLNILVPTIRKPNSEIWFSWNPRDKKDPVDAMFRGDAGPPPNSIVREVNWDDNPWFPEVLRAEMEWDRERDPDKYAHVWGGGYVVHSESRVFKNWKIGTEEIPAGARPYYGADWGFAKDPAVLIRLWIIGPRQLYIDAEAYQVGCEIDKTPELFDKIDNGQARKWPIKADSARPETISYMQRHGYPHIVPAIKGPGSVEDGVEFLKSYDITIHPDCRHASDEFTYYSYKTDRLTDEVLPVLEDKKNHVIDACIAEGQMITCLRGQVPIENVTTDDFVLTRDGYKKVLFSGLTDTNRELVRIETTNGTVDCTPDHRIYTSKGFVRADALCYNDKVINLEHGKWSKLLHGTVESIGSPRLVPGLVVAIKDIKIKSNVYDLTVEDQPEFFAGGVLVHNCRYALESTRMSLVGDQPEQDFLFDPADVKVLSEWPKVYGLDVNGGSASVVWGAHDPHSDTVYLFGEYVEDKARLETWAAGIRSRNKRQSVPGIFDMTARRRTEEQGEKIVESLLDQSLDIYTSEADVESAASEINGRIATQQLKVASNLTNWLSQYRAYRRDAKGDIVEEGDGLMHATGLLLVSGLNIAMVDPHVADAAAESWQDMTRDPVTGY